MSGKGICRRKERLGCAFAATVLLLWAAGCSASASGLVPSAAPLPGTLTEAGSYHTVQHGESLWRIARSFGLDVDTLAQANALPSAHRVEAGQLLFIPIPSASREGFVWPVRGPVQDGHISSGIAIAAPKGAHVRAAQRGVVALATRRLLGWGGAVILDHQNGYFSVYAGLDHLIAQPGQALHQGMLLGALGPRALHFEIREGTLPIDPLVLLPEA